MRRTPFLESLSVLLKPQEQSMETFSNWTIGSTALASFYSSQRALRSGDLENVRSEEDEMK